MRRSTVTALTEAYTLVRVALDRRTPNQKRVLVVVVLTAAYVLSPVDLFSDLVPIVGWTDDVVIGLLGRHAVYQLVPREIVEEHRQAASSHLLVAGGFTLLIVVVLVGIVLVSLGVV
ncbi:YkvA family protein [Halocatena pleomorpha]|uniref:DUF1232 domain-containing protein n=1 Tax=Halocatena pleomorpha TaxID=1785090 RepID=A0A3P3R662_9EURY|nr:YkvA family protein [Halocatena pleomorpha]RRJ28937.1 DUF1232 domain-containing protein [Halocatena pleomorpha]